MNHVNKTAPICVSVIIPVYNGKVFIDACLRSLLRDTTGNTEIIAVVDESTDGSYDYLVKKYSSRIIVLRQPARGGTVRGINQGVKHARGLYVFVVGQDSEVLPGWSTHIPDFFHSHPLAAVGQVKMLKSGSREYDYAGDLLSTFGFLVERARGATDTGQFDSITTVFSVKGGGMFFRKDRYQEIGGMDDNYFFGWEEPDFTWRCWIAGYETYFFPDITLYHAFGTIQKARMDEYYLTEANIFYHGCKNHLTSLMSLLEIKRVYWMVPFVFCSYIILSILFFISGSKGKSISLVQGAWWVLANIPSILKRRIRLQKTRILSDDEIMKRVGISQPMWYYIGKGIAYIRARAF